MSKAIIASDIHGNLPYTEQLEKLIIKENPDYLILLGDLESFQGSPEIVSILNKYANIIYAVRGNNDPLDTDGKFKFNNNQEYSYIKMDNLKFFLTHGHNLWKYLKESEGCYVLCGHTHIYNIYGKIINPGSVGRPRLNPEHTCLLYENKNFSLINLDDFSIIDSHKIS